MLEQPYLLDHKVKAGNPGTRLLLAIAKDAAIPNQEWEIVPLPDGFWLRGEMADSLLEVLQEFCKRSKRDELIIPYHILPKDRSIQYSGRGVAIVTSEGYGTAAGILNPKDDLLMQKARSRLETHIAQSAALEEKAASQQTVDLSSLSSLSSQELAEVAARAINELSTRSDSPLREVLAGLHNNVLEGLVRDVDYIQEERDDADAKAKASNTNADYLPWG